MPTTTAPTTTAPTTTAPTTNLPTADDPEKQISGEANTLRNSFAAYIKDKSFDFVREGVETYTDPGLLAAVSPLLRELGLDPALRRWAVWKLSGSSLAVFTAPGEMYWIPVYTFNDLDLINDEGTKLKDGFVRYWAEESIQINPGQICISYVKP